MSRLCPGYEDEYLTFCSECGRVDCCVTHSCRASRPRHSPAWRNPSPGPPIDWEAVCGPDSVKIIKEVTP